MARLAALVALVATAGCVTLPPDTFVLTPELLKQRQIETRKYSGIEEKELLIACSNVLQDLGFNLENSEVRLGVLTASKQRDAIQAGEVAMAIALALLGGGATPISKDQTIRISLVVRPVRLSDGSASQKEHFVRITVQRIVRRTDNSVIAQGLNDPELFRQFFERVSKSVFLEAQNI
jgi:hypothetical protein